MSDLAEDFIGLDNQSWQIGQKRGVSTSLHFEDEKIVIQKDFDAEPLLDDCAASRSGASNQWGDGQVVGSIPAPIYWKMVREGTAFDPRAVKAFFQSNPHFLRYERFIK